MPFFAVEAEEFRSEKDRFDFAVRLLYEPAPGKQKEILRTALKHLKICYQEQETWGRDPKALSGRAFHAGIASWYLGEREKALKWFEISYQAFPFAGEALYNRWLIFMEMNLESDARRERLRLDTHLKNEKK